MRYIQLKTTNAVPAGPDIRRITLADPDGWPLPPVRPGAHVDLHLPAIGARAYSLCGDPAEDTRWEIAVKREAASRGGSRWLHDDLAIGDTIAASLPRCTFPLAPAASRHCMIAGGIGVTPFLSMAPVLERQGAAWQLHVLHRSGLPCPAELAPWQALGRVVVHDTAAAGRPGWTALLGEPTAGLQAYCCGPPAMIAAFAEATSDWAAGTARVEHFIPPPPAAAPDARSYTAHLLRSNRRLPVAAGQSLLGVLRGAGVPVEASCEGGICGACEVRWQEGAPIHRDRVLSPERRNTHLMACVAQCASDELVLDL